MTSAYGINEPREVFPSRFVGCISKLQDRIHAGNVARGWWTDLKTGKPVEKTCDHFLAKLALVHSEVSEALEGHRKGLMDDHLPHRPMDEVELADAIIRILDLAGGYGLDIEGAIEEKLEYNAKRADHKIINRKKEGGKKS